MLIDGKWTGDWHPVASDADDRGRFVRKSAAFRNWVTPDGAPGPTGHGGFRAEPGRYHLYVAYICPWASRALAVRNLKRLQSVVGVSVVEPVLSAQGWRFGDYPGATEDAVNGVRFVHELYTRADPAYTGRATVPVLWDRRQATIVSNESADIVRMLNSGFDTFADAAVDLYPQSLRAEIDALNDRVYARLNNGVYQAGFASTQSAYEEAVHAVFAMLDELEARLADGRPHLLGEVLTETDIRVFVTLVRFDAAYHGLFKCNLRRIVDYPRLAAFLRRLQALPGIAETVNLDHIKAGYYSIRALNPSGIVPVGPLSAAA